MSIFLQATAQTLVQVLKPQAPPLPPPQNTTVHTAVEGQGMSATDQVLLTIYKTQTIMFFFFVFF